MKETMRFMVNVIDDSMSPNLLKGDIAFVRSGFDVEDGGIGVVIVTDHEAKSTKLLVRRVHFEENRIKLTATNRKYPALVFEGEERNNVRLLGPIYKMHRTLAPHQPRWIALSGIAQGNRAALESRKGKIVGELADEE